MDYSQENSNIVLKEGQNLNPLKVDLQFIKEEQNVLDSIKSFDYDLSVYDISLSSIECVQDDSDKKKIRKLFIDSNVLTISKIMSLKLYDLSVAGIGLADIDDDAENIQEANKSRYKYINQLIHSANKLITREKHRERAFSDSWASQTEIIQEKYTEAGFKNKLTIKKLYGFNKIIANKLSTAQKLLKSNNFERVYEKLNDFSCFIDKNFHILKEYNKTNIADNNDLFKKLNMRYDIHSTGCTYGEIEDFKKVLRQYIYFFRCYNFFLNKTLKILKEKKISKLSDIFKANSVELKKEIMNSVPDEDYRKFNIFNLNTLYDWFRDTLIGLVHNFVTKDIILKKRLENLMQYAPDVSGIIIFVSTLIVSFIFNFTLLKNKQVVNALLLMYGGIFICAVVQLINFIKHTYIIKKPKRRKFSAVSLCAFLGITAVFFTLNTYFIERYDGYNDNYYYVVNDDGDAVIDRLFLKKDSYRIPSHIDNKKVALVSKKAFRNRKNVLSVFFDNDVPFEEKAFKGCTNLQEIFLPPCMNFVPEKAFQGCNYLNKITFSSNPVTIGKNAFKGCRNLGSFPFDNVVYLSDSAFLNCNKLSDVSFNTALTNIGNSAFRNCHSMSFNSLPDNVESIGKNAFRNCLRLERINLGPKLKHLGKNAFTNYNGVTKLYINDLKSIGYKHLDKFFGSAIKENVENITIENCEMIPDGYFKDFATLNNCTVGGNIKSIGKEAFMGCSYLKQLTLPETYTTIGNKAFYNCDILNGFKFPETLTSIGEQAFSGCNSIHDIVFPDSINHIGANAFENCNSLFSLKIKNFDNKLTLNHFIDMPSLHNIKQITLKNSGHINDHFFDGCAELENLYLDAKPIHIGAYAFKDCETLNNFDFADSAIYIGEGAFYNCLSLNDITLDNSITAIPDYAFYNTGLVKIKLPFNAVTIGKQAYYGCKELTSIMISSKMEKLGDEAFGNCQSINSCESYWVKSPLEQFLGELTTKKLTNITLYLGNTTTIPDNYFRGCKNLTELDIKGEVTKIGKEAFKDCTRLSSFVIPLTVTEIGDSAFMNSGITNAFISEKVSHLGKNVFKDSSYLTKANIFCDLKHIPEGTFENCYLLAIVNSYYPIESVGNSAFYGCNYLTDFSSFNTVVDFGDRAFCDCWNFKGSDFSNKVKHIGKQAFYKSHIDNLTIVNSDAIIEDSAFKECYIDNVTLSQGINKGSFDTLEQCFDAGGPRDTLTVIDCNKIHKKYFRTCTHTQKIVLNGPCDKVGTKAFYGLTDVQQVVLSENIKVIGRKAFADMKNLQSVTFNSEVETIKRKAFEHCKNLKSVELPVSVKKIGNYAFDEDTTISNLDALEQNKFAKHFNDNYISFFVSLYKDHKAFFFLGLFAIVGALILLGKKIKDSRL